MRDADGEHSTIKTRVEKRETLQQRGKKASGHLDSRGTTTSNALRRRVRRFSRLLEHTGRALLSAMGKLCARARVYNYVSRKETADSHEEATNVTIRPFTPFAYTMNG